MNVISPGNFTKDGQWYKVIVQGHTLNILSAAQLKPGQKLLIEKAGTLRLKIVSEKPSGEEKIDEKQEQAKVLKEIKILDMGKKENYLPLENVKDLLNLMSVYFLEKHTKISFAFDRRRLFFSLPMDSFSEPAIIKGIFITLGNEKWDLMIHFSNVIIDGLKKHPGFQMKSFIAQLKDFICDLNIANIHITTEAHIDTLRGGFDLTS